MRDVLEFLGGWFAISCLCGVPVGRLLRERVHALAQAPAPAEPVRAARAA